MIAQRHLRRAALLAAVLAASPAAAEVRVIPAPGIAAPRFPAPPERAAAPPAPVKPPAPIVDRRLGPVVVESGERLRAGRLHIRLPGVAAVGADEVCRDADGVDWDCGRRALLGLRAALRLKPVVCPLPADARSGEVETTCLLLAGGEVGRLFVASGWARALADGPYVADETRARAEGRGIWAAAPAPAAAPAVAATAPPVGTDGLPPDVTTAPLGGADGRTPPLGGADGRTAPLGGGGGAVPPPGATVRTATPAEGSAGAPLRLGQ
jgi:endonuclease YncB( thermonuclease family)